MAEIIVEPDNRDPKRNDKSSIWPWILGALLLFGLIWVIVEVTGDDEPERVATTTAVDRQPVTDNTYRDDTYAQTAAAGPIAEFIRFANEGEEQYERENVTNAEYADREGEQGAMGLEHNYTSDGIRKLSAALNALAQNSAGDTEIDQKRTQFQANADRIQQDPQSLQHANTIRQTFVEASDLMATIKQRSYPNSNANVDDVREAAEDIDVSTATLEQKDKVKEFFDKAGDAVEQLAEDGNINIENQNNMNDQNRVNQPEGVNTNTNMNNSNNTTTDNTNQQY
jgi:hypothetical protein